MKPHIRLKPEPIRIIVGNNPIRIIEINAFPIRMPAAPNYSFFLHGVVFDDDKPNPEAGWCVSEKTTGRMIGAYSWGLPVDFVIRATNQFLEKHCEEIDTQIALYALPQ